MRISVTTVEQFRLYQTADFVTEENLQASIRGEFKPTQFMRNGSAFHSILEAPERFKVERGYSADGIFFPDDVVAPCLAVSPPGGVHEAKAVKVYDLRTGPVTVVAKADKLLGLRITERKTKWSGFNFDNYADAYQWRFYCDIFRPASVTYDVFCLDEQRDGFVLKSIESFTLYPYPAVHQDCVELLTQFVDYVNMRGLGSYLERAGEAF